MSVQWTPEQEQAICLRGCNMLVSAGAGSGKTAVLTARIVGLLKEGAQITDMLVVTFTNAAAAEMKRRIAQNLMELCASGDLDAATRKHLREQVLLMGKANISTLHAFCVSVLRRHFQQAGFDPAFRVGDELESALLRSEAAQECIDELHEGGGGDGFFALCESVGKGESALPDLILRVHAFLFAQENPWAWLDDAVARYALDARGVAQTEAYSTLCAEAADDAAKAAQLLTCARAKLPGDAAFDKARAQLDDEAMSLRAYASQMAGGTDRCGAAVEALFLYKFDTLRFPKSDFDTAPVKALRDHAKDLIKGIVGKRAYFSAAAQAELLALMRPQVEALAALVRAFDERYGEKKRQAGIIDFADIEHGALAALGHPSIAAEYREKFPHIFVDEYQDSNVVQEALIDRIRREDNLFCVGDVKQSIYRFRLAEPTLFSARQEAYAAQKGGVLVPLNANFRSAHNVLNCVNDLFSRVMNGAQSEIGYDETAKLHPGRLERDCAALTVDVLEKNTDDDEGLEALLDAEWEARQAARRIRERLGQLFYDEKKKETRAYRYGDFAVLLRATKSVAHAFARVFAQEGIPAFAELTGGFFEAVEVQVFVNLLRLCDNRRQDIPLLSALRGGIGGFSDEDILQVRERCRTGSYFDALRQVANQPDALGAKASAFLAFLAQARRQSRVLRLDRFLEDLLDQTGYLDAVSILEGGAQRAANVEALLERARAYETSAGQGLSGFLTYLDRLGEGGEVGEARLSGEDADCVRIMSVHKSKGLEFPVVILAMTGRKFNLRDAQSDYALHRSLGLGCSAFYAAARTRAGTLYRAAIAAATRRESISEEMRILYVAMTRAMEELIVLGSVSDTAKQADRWREGEAHCPLDWILCASLRFETNGTLRERIGYANGFGCEEKEGEWTLNLVLRAELAASGGVAARAKALEDWIAAAQTADPSAVARRFSWRYPHGIGVPSKLAASRLGGEQHAELDETPRFLAQKTLTAADIGTALHAALYYLDLRGALDEVGIERQIERMVERELMTKEQARAVNATLLAGFFSSGLGRRMAAAEELHREQPFTFLKSARSLIGADSDERIVVQGVIDAYFKADGGWVLLDYKSDSVKEHTQEACRAVAETHRPQLDLYAEALQRQTGLPVREKHIFLLRAGVSVAL